MELKDEIADLHKNKKNKKNNPREKPVETTR